MTTGAATTKIMAHRGGNTGAPNTLEAITNAAAAGAVSMELDLNTTADGVVVAFHNAALEGWEWISDRTYADLLALDRAEWERRLALDVIGSTLELGASLYLDLKSVTPEALRAIAAAWPDHVAAGEIVFAAARADVVGWVGENLPGASSSFLYYDRQLDLHSLASFIRPTFVHPCFDHLRDPMASVDERYVERARSLGFGLVSWNELDPGRVTRLAELGFDYVCTDDPAMAVQALQTVPAP